MTREHGPPGARLSRAALPTADFCRDLAAHALELFLRLPHSPLILRSVAKRSVSKDGDAKDGAAAFMRCSSSVPVATKGAGGYPRAARDTPLRSVPQGEVVPVVPAKSARVRAALRAADLGFFLMLLSPDRGRGGERGIQMLSAIRSVHPAARREMSIGRVGSTERNPLSQPLPLSGERSMMPPGQR